MLTTVKNLQFRWKTFKRPTSKSTICEENSKEKTKIVCAHRYIVCDNIENSVNSKGFVLNKKLYFL